MLIAFVRKPNASLRSISKDDTPIERRAVLSFLDFSLFNSCIIKAKEGAKPYPTKTQLEIGKNLCKSYHESPSNYKYFLLRVKGRKYHHGEPNGFSMSGCQKLKWFLCMFV